MIKIEMAVTLCATTLMVGMYIGMCIDKFARKVAFKKMIKHIEDDVEIGKLPREDADDIIELYKSFNKVSR